MFPNWLDIQYRQEIYAKQKRPEKLTNLYLHQNLEDYYSKKDATVLSGLVKHPYHFRETNQYLSDIPVYRYKFSNKMLKESTTVTLLF